MSIDYSRSYIKQAISSEKIEPPDKTKANGTFEALIGIFMAHQVGGIQAALAAWDTLKKLRPDLSEFDKAGKLIHADELKNLTQPSYLVGDYPLYSDGFNVLFGESGIGKSFVALDIAGRVAAESVVVYIAGEGVNGYASRWESWKDFHQCHNAELYFWTEALQVIEERSVWEFFNELEDKGKIPKLVIIDTLARSAVGVDENSATAMGQFIHAIDSIGSRLKCSTLVVHHTGKQGSIRGSGSLYNAADAVLSLNKYMSLVRLSNKHEHGGKNKNAPENFEAYFKITAHSANGFDGGVIVPAEKIEDENESSMPEHHRTILDALLDSENGLSVRALEEETGIKQRTLYRTLTDLTGSYKYTGCNKGLYTITEQGKAALGGNL
jgi:hypothetical protein